MSALPELRQADCGHWIHADSEPSGTDQAGHPIYLCIHCSAVRPVRRIETKAVQCGGIVRAIGRVYVVGETGPEYPVPRIVCEA